MFTRLRAGQRILANVAAARGWGDCGCLCANSVGENTLGTVNRTAAAASVSAFVRSNSSSFFASSAYQSSEADGGGAGHSEEEAPKGEEEIKIQLLDTALAHVKSKGWSQDALRAAATQLGYSPSFVGILTRGESQLVEHFIVKCNQELDQALHDLGPAYLAQGMTARVRHAVQLRLQMLIPYIDSWPQALAILTRPENAAQAFNLLQDLVDIIWLAAGDKSTDLSWYSKRMLLAGVYSATELFMLADCSPEYSDTWDALDRRLADVANVGSLARKFSDAFVKS